MCFDSEDDVVWPHKCSWNDLGDFFAQNQINFLGTNIWEKNI